MLQTATLTTKAELNKMYTERAKRRASLKKDHQKLHSHGDGEEELTNENDGSLPVGVGH